MDYKTALDLTKDRELAIKLLEADASQRKSEALVLIAKNFDFICGIAGLKISID